MNSRIDALRREKDGMDEQRRELALLIKQAAAEVDHLAQRNREVSSKMRQLEANLEGFSKAEIKQLFSASQEAQMRLFMMQSQLEQLRSRQGSLEKMEQQLDDLLGMADLVANPVAPTGTPSHPQDSAGTAPASGRGKNGSAGAALQSIELASHRLSRQLQDGTAQALSDLILRAEVCDRLAELDMDKFREEMAQLRQAASGALRRVRHLVQELQPPALEELGLVAALRRYIQAARSAHKLQVELQLSGQERRLPLSAEVAIFRIIQEALSNVAHHSGVSRAEVKLAFESGKVSAIVSDQGKGFEVESALEEAKQKEHSGLADMQTRARLAGAALEISSSPAAGTTVSLALPA